MGSGAASLAGLGFCPCSPHISSRQELPVSLWGSVLWPPLWERLFNQETVWQGLLAFVSNSLNSSKGHPSLGQRLLVLETNQADAGQRYF